MLEKAGAAVLGALIKVGLIIAAFVVVAFLFGWASNPAHKQQRDETGNSVVDAGFTSIDAGADAVTHWMKSHTNATPAPSR
jgi:hypothetical protein